MNGFLTAAQIGGLLALPCLLFVVCLAINDQRRFSVLLIGLIAFNLGLASLFLTAPGDIPLPLSFFNEPIFLSFSSTSQALFLALAIALLAMLLHQRPCISKWQAALLSVSLLAGFLAFFSGQFMIRYIALEVTGLCCALSVVNAGDKNNSRIKQFSLIFIMLRLGDLGLWAAILILQNRIGSLAISAMIEAAAALPQPDKLWVLGGFLFAVLVKCAIWPVGLWMQYASGKKDQWPRWISAFLMPALGLYLLYRIRPILQSQPLLQIGVAGLAAGLMLAPMISSALKWVTIQRFTLLNSLASALAIYLAAYGDSPTLRTYFLGLIGFRLIVWFEDQLPGFARPWAAPVGLILLHAAIAPQILRSPTGAMIGLAILALLTTLWAAAFKKSPPRQPAPPPRWIETSLEKIRVWENKLWPGLTNILITTADSLYRWIELDLFTKGFTKVSRGIVKAADWLQETIENGLEKSWQELGRKVQRLSKTALNQLEDPQGERSQAVTSAVLNSLENGSQRRQRKSFRWDLVWIPLFLLIILIFLFFSQKG